jgi:YggT family protein
MLSLYLLIDKILEIYVFIVFAMVIMSWLVGFNVVNMRNRFVATVADILNRLTEPVLRPIRRVLPTMGGLDLSPVVLLLGIWFLRNLLAEYFPR